MRSLEIHVITDDKQTVAELAKRIIFIHEEVDYLHIREKSKSTAEIMEIVSIVHKNGVPKRKLVINDRMDVALLNQIPNVHLPGHGFSIEKVKSFDPSIRVGRSVHSLQEAIDCEQAGADYLLFGHIFETSSKTKVTPRGVQQLSEICRRVDIPVIAIGGIVPETIPELVGVEISGIAVMSYVMASKKPNDAIRELKQSVVYRGGVS